jgi:hypothetical protein
MPSFLKEIISALFVTLQRPIHRFNIIINNRLKWKEIMKNYSTSKYLQIINIGISTKNNNKLNLKSTILLKT